MVTPPSKNGEPPVANGANVSADGERLSFSSLGGFNDPGDDSTAEGGEYVATRSPTGWTVTPVNPSAQQFQDGGPEIEGGTHETLDFNAALTQSLFLKPPLGAKPIDSRFYFREVSNGEATEIGSMLSPETVAAWTPQVAEEGGDFPRTVYAGASDDLSHVLFSQTLQPTGAFQWFWPGDTTGGDDSHSLYEYSGAHSTEPELVGVRNQTSLSAAAAQEHKPHINEAAELISECGTYIGALETNSNTSHETYNAISASGNVVFFTAGASNTQGGCNLGGPPVAELSARIDEEKTIAISEPTTGAAGDCTACNDSEPQTAVFQGASEDGSRAFFLSEQQLFSGAQGEQGVNLYEYDFEAPAGQKVSLVASELPHGYETNKPAGVVRVTEGGNYVYFVSHAALAGNANQAGIKASAGEAQFNLYIFDTATRQTIFIASLSASDQYEWAESDAGRGVEATPDGRFLLFSSTKPLIEGTRNEARQLYRYEAPSEADPDGRLVRVSVGAPGAYACSETGVSEEGFNCNGNAAAPSGSVFEPTYRRPSEPTYAVAMRAAQQPVAMVNDGSEIFFQSPAALTPEALNDGCAYGAEGECYIASENVYEWENGDVYLISDGQDAHAFLGGPSTRLIGADPTGTNVFFDTADPLVNGDTDTQVDIYDARVGGGVPETSTEVLCSTACQGAKQPVPIFASPGSELLSGDGELIPAAPPPATGKAPALSRAQKLAKALKACKRKRPRKTRVRCEEQAKRRYGRSKK